MFTLAGCNDQNTKNEAAEYGIGLAQEVSAINSQIESPVATKEGPFLDTLIEEADFVFKGILTEISYGLSMEEIPYTFVTYSVDEIINGNYQSETITLKFVGGPFPNGNMLSASNSPLVKIGEESILFVQQRADTGCDFVRCEQGRFLLKEGKIIAANESAIVVDEKGGIDYISNSAQKDGRHKRSLEKSNIPNFISKLKVINTKIGAKTTVMKNTDKSVLFNAYAALTKAGQAPAVLKLRSIDENTSKGSSHDQWEVQQLKRNNGNPILVSSSPFANE